MRPLSATRSRLPGGLVHLPINEGHLVENAGVGHLVVEVVALAGTFPHACEHRGAGVLGRDVANELHEGHRLAHAGATKQTNLATLVERTDEVDDLDTGLENLDRRRLVGVARGLAMNRPALLFADGTLVINRPPEDVHDPTQSLRADRHLHRITGVVDPDATLQSIGRPHRDGAHHPIANLLLDLEGQAVLDLERIVNLGHQVAGELNVHHRTDDRDNLSGTHESVPQII